MDVFNALLLGVLQGITEFLPISSSGHLILAESFMKLPVEELKSFDIAIHFGTLLAIFIYFRKDFVYLFKGCMALIKRFIFRTKGHHASEESKKNEKMVRYLLVATIPAVGIGLFFNDFLDANFRNANSVAMMLIAVGIFFFVAEYVAKRMKQVELNQTNSLLIGVAQACALIPGVSRSGATISTGLIQGIKREEAAKFSFLLGSIAITAAMALSVYKITKGEFLLPPPDILLAGILSSFVSGYLAIAFLMKFLKNHSLHIFGAYRVILGVVILYFL